MSKVPPIPAELWDLVPPAAQAALLLILQRSEQRIAQLEQQVAQLQAQLAQDSSNSHRPPSTDGPAVKRAPPQPPSGRRKGAQPGHQLQARPLLPPDHIYPIKPSACRRCGHALHGDDPAPLRHQVLDLPPIKPLVSEYQLHRLTCPACGSSTCGQPPPGVPTGQTAPRLQAALALLAGAYRLSKRQIEAVCAELLSIPICAGSVCALEQQTTQALAPVVAELADYVPTQPANVDETSWRQASRRAWLWVAVTAGVTLFHIACSRGGKVVRDLLGGCYDGILTSDRWSAYNGLPVRLRQLCWAHLKRDFQAMVDRHNAGSAIGEELLCCAQDLFTWWYRVRDGTLSRSTFRKKVAELRPHVRRQLDHGTKCGCARTAGTCKELLKLFGALWTFARVEGIEPTNNAAERALRHAVQWRKSSYGTDSVGGSEFVSSILSVVATCRQQGRDVLEYLTACCVAYNHGKLPPSLLPQITD
jgi:transposase